MIDHIPAHLGIKILKLFKLHKTEQRITMGLNLPSSALGNKDLIKIENIFLTKGTSQSIGSVRPQATVNQLKNTSGQQAHTCAARTNQQCVRLPK